MCNIVTIKNNVGDKINVADIKANAIKNIINLAGNCDLIDYIFLFGSSAEERCTTKSDIDIAIIADACDSKLIKNKGFNLFRNGIYDIDMEQNYDILQFRTLDELKKREDCICKSILEKGQIIYSKTKEV
ncbi:MAG: nucleotidyltransferase domain-containing protein [Clostridium sp.]|nr:nucleotidyltransferase domain-containing protein [Clostridium sp.]